MSEAIHFYAEYKGTVFNMQFGSQAFILQCGIDHDIDKDYGIEELCHYYNYVHNCYLKDSNQTPLGALSDYIADHWKELKKQDYYTVLEKFYEQLN